VSKSEKALGIILFVLVLISLALNGFVIWQLRNAQRRVQAAVREFGPVVEESLSQLISDLEDFEKTPLEFDIDVQQDIPIQTEIAFDETIAVPIQLTVPISQTIETTVVLSLVGGVELPIDIAVPVNVEIPIDNTITVPIERIVPISTTIPLDVKVPIQIDLTETELSAYINRLRQSLVLLNNFVEEALTRLE